MMMMHRFVVCVLNSTQTRCPSQSNRWDLRCRANVRGDSVAVRRAAGRLFQMCEHIVNDMHYISKGIEVGKLKLLNGRSDFDSDSMLIKQHLFRRWFFRGKPQFVRDILKFLNHHINPVFILILWIKHADLQDTADACQQTTYKHTTTTHCTV